MAAFTAIGLVGEIVFLGLVPEGAGLRSYPVERMELGWNGALGEKHSGKTRPACGRVQELHPRGTEIANVRQLTILSAEELAKTALAMGLPDLDPCLVGANIVLRGVPDLTHLPPSARLQGPDGATLVVDMENLPCTLAAKEVEAHHKGFGAAYKPAAAGRRGVTAWVERSGVLEMGQSLRLYIPAQRPWAADARHQGGLAPETGRPLTQP